MMQNLPFVRQPPYVRLDQYKAPDGGFCATNAKRYTEVVNRAFSLSYAPDGNYWIDDLDEAGQTKPSTSGPFTTAFLLIAHRGLSREELVFKLGTVYGITDYREACQLADSAQANGKITHQP
jgi:hypothetical protein